MNQSSIIFPEKEPSKGNPWKTALLNRCAAYGIGYCEGDTPDVMLDRLLILSDGAFDKPTSGTLKAPSHGTDSPHTDRMVDWLLIGGICHGQKRRLPAEVREHHEPMSYLDAAHHFVDRSPRYTVKNQTYQAIDWVANDGKKYRIGYTNPADLLNRGAVINTLLQSKSVRPIG